MTNAPQRTCLFVTGDSARYMRHPVPEVTMAFECPIKYQPTRRDLTGTSIAESNVSTSKQRFDGNQHSWNKLYMRARNDNTAWRLQMYVRAKNDYSA
ncbi:hypothetical protein DPMN_130023 [Dreissena polymorpha]|uniref:Uncharacterized protein n=1 Tax=Dreissena polymorpha TaxID=45954 RepID=A0A9D4H609_DREPO|nr:hypothetical protein DPMN_130023 [Dreissena polymorpha]